MMKKIGLDELKAIELQMLQYIDQVCRNNNLTYFLAYGSLLGAVRHKGFIPWDDDIDLHMPHRDLEILESILNSTNSPYQLLTHNTRGYYYTFCKIVDKRTYIREHRFTEEIPQLGVYIDIFQFDGLPQIDSDKHLESINKTRAKLALYAYHGCRPRKNVFYFLKKKIEWLVIKSHDMSFYQQQMYELQRKYDYYVSENVVDVGSPYRYTFPRCMFDEIIDAEFEGIKIRIPRAYDAYLTKAYGDYMALPPVEKRVTHHDFDAYWRDTSRR